MKAPAVRIYVALFILVVILGGTQELSLSAESLPSPQQYKVSTIRFTGLRTVDPNQLKELMLTKECGLYFWKKYYYNELILQEDLVRIKEYYQSHGFYHTTVEPFTEPSGNRIAVVLAVSEGQPTLISSLHLSFSGEKTAWYEAMVKALPLQEGDIFSTSKYNDLKEYIVEQFANDGFSQVHVDGTVKVFKKENQADILIVVDSGKRTTIEDIILTGNDRISENIVFREMQTRPGELYSFRQLNQDKKRLYDLDLFRTVQFNTVNTDSANDSVQLQVMVEEKPPREIKIGVGYGSEDLLRIRTELLWRNIFSKGYSLRFSAKYSSLTSSLESIFFNPYLFGSKDLDLTMKAGYESEHPESYSNSRYFSKLDIRKGWNTVFSNNLAYNIESNETDKVSKNISDAVLKQYGHHEDENFLLSSIEVGFHWDRTEGHIEPTQGYKVNYIFEPTLTWLGSDIDFVRHRFELRGYYSFVPEKRAGDAGARTDRHGNDDRHVTESLLAGKLLLGTVNPTSANDYIPISKRFFCGGSNSVRGYSYQGIGSKDESGIPVGGYSLLEGSLELRFPLYGDLRGVTFIDAGNVFADSFQFQTDQLIYSVGFGLRYYTVVGPIRIDLGYQLNPRDDDAGPFRLHLNLGEAF